MQKNRSEAFVQFSDCRKLRSFVFHLTTSLPFPQAPAFPNCLSWGTLCRELAEQSFLPLSEQSQECQGFPRFVPDERISEWPRLRPALCGAKESGRVFYRTFRQEILLIGSENISFVRPCQRGAYAMWATPYFSSHSCSAVRWQYRCVSIWFTAGFTLL